jgi:hypothetical protein
VNFATLKDLFPQPVKPRIFPFLSGTAKAVPFQSDCFQSKCNCPGLNLARCCRLFPAICYSEKSGSEIRIGLFQRAGWEGKNFAPLPTPPPLFFKPCRLIHRRSWKTAAKRMKYSRLCCMKRIFRRIRPCARKRKSYTTM